jgi:negative regulator of flagellin synthesis FlgM
MLPTPVGATDGLPPSARSGLAEVGARAAKPKPLNSGAEEIADDSEQVSMAGMLISQASGGSDVRFEKVAALRRKIEAGTYNVTAEDVAEKLMDSMRKK